MALRGFVLTANILLYYLWRSSYRLVLFSFKATGGRYRASSLPKPFQKRISLCFPGAPRSGNHHRVSTTSAPLQLPLPLKIKPPPFCIKLVRWRNAYFCRSARLLDGVHETKRWEHAATHHSRHLVGALLGTGLLYEEVHDVLSSKRL